MTSVQEQRAGVRWLLAAPLACYVASIVGFLAWSRHIRLDFPLDDAWIHRVYARALAFGQGFAYNPGQQEPGSTSPLWAVVSAPAHWLQLAGDDAVVLGVKLLGAACGALAVVLLWDVALRLTEHRGVAALAASVFAVEPRLAFSALSGMENVLLVALWLAVTDAILARRHALALALIGLLPLARPEAVVTAALALAVVVASAGLTNSVWRRPVPWATLILPAAAWALFCRIAGGHWLPTTYYVKAEAAVPGMELLRTAWVSLTGHGWVSLLPFVAGIFAVVVWTIKRRSPMSAGVMTLLVAAPLFYLLAVVGSREMRVDGYYWTRWADPGSLVLVAACGIGLGLLLIRAPAASREAANRRTGLAWVVAAVIGGVLLGASLPALGRGWIERRDRLASDGAAIRRMNVEPAFWVRDNVPEQAVVGVNDAGALRYFGGRRTIDLLGLNHADLVHGRVTRSEIVRELDWVAVFPRLFPQTMFEMFEPRQVFRISDAEYTVCDCPLQTTKVVAERRR